MRNRNSQEQKMRARGSQEDLSRDIQLSLIEEKIRDVLAMLRSLNTMKISEEVLGRMVVEAVEKAFDPVAGEVAIFRFLALLYRSTRDFERKAAESMLDKSLRIVSEDAVETSDSSSSSNMPGRMETLKPRRPKDRLSKEPGFQIHF